MKIEDFVKVVKTDYYKHEYANGNLHYSVVVTMRFFWFKLFGIPFYYKRNYCTKKEGAIFSLNDNYGNRVLGYMFNTEDDAKYMTEIATNFFIRSRLNNIRIKSEKIK